MNDAELIAMVRGMRLPLGYNQEAVRILADRLEAVTKQRDALREILTEVLETADHSLDDDAYWPVLGKARSALNAQREEQP